MCNYHFIHFFKCQKNKWHLTTLAASWQHLTIRPHADISDILLSNISSMCIWESNAIWTVYFMTTIIGLLDAYTQQTWDFEPMLLLLLILRCWPNVFDVGSTTTQHWLKVSNLLGKSDETQRLLDTTHLSKTGKYHNLYDACLECPDLVFVISTHCDVNDHLLS